MDMRIKAMYMKASPVLPPRQESELTEGLIYKWLKIGFEKYFMYKIRHGASAWPY